MAFRLKLNEPIDGAIRRIAAGQLDRAVAEVEAIAGEAGISAVHETRKCIKRTRALLRFARPLFDPDDCKRADRALRDVGRLLSPTRDLDVLTQTLAALHGNRSLRPATIARLEKLVTAARSAITAETGDAPGRETIAEHLKALRATIPDWKIARSDDRLPTDGLAACLERCRGDFAHAFSAKHEEAFHDWRKSVQLHWRQMQLVKRAWPVYCEARLEEARALSALIGTDRDLALLKEFAVGHPLPKTQLREIERMVGAHQNLLRAEAKARGERLLTEGTDGFCRRLERYWAIAVRLRRAERQRIAAMPGNSADGT